MCGSQNKRRNCYSLWEDEGYGCCVSVGAISRNYDALEKHVDLLVISIATMMLLRNMSACVWAMAAKTITCVKRLRW